ncbi:MAG: hypothetical protein AB7V10_07795 [Leucobacter sp.]|jgi:hypothetical protein
MDSEPITGSMWSDDELAGLIRDLGRQLAGERRGERLDTLAQLLGHVEGLIEVEVAQLRAEGVPWSSIGGDLGVSKQAAQQRYGD